jgi:hypothetical protein
MSQPKPIIKISSSTTLESVLERFLQASDDVVFVDENSVITEPHLELLTDFPRSSSAALVGKLPDFTDTLVTAGSVVSASSASHTTTTSNRVFTGALRLSKRQGSEIKVALENAIAKDAKGHPLDLLLVALVRATIKVDAVELVGAPFARSEDPAIRQSAEKEISKIKLSKLRLKMANRANDGFFSVFVLRRISKILTALAVKIGATPNQVTIASFAIGLYAAYLFALGDTWSLIVGAILLQVSIIVDCVDGEIARYNRKFSELGAWLDAISDRVKEYAVFLGLAYGAFVQNGQNLWLLAAILMTLQTFRHLSDYNFAQVTKARVLEAEPVIVDYLADWDGIKEAAEDAADTSYLFKRVKYWLGKIIVFPIGERWLAISFTAAVGGAMFTFYALPVLVLISMLWVYKVRTKKSLDMPKTKIKSAVIVRQLDLGFVSKSSLVRFDWLEPSLVRLFELGSLIVLFALTDNLGVASFVILFSIAFHHYDNLYRSMQDEQKPAWARWLGLSVLGRTGLITLVVLGGFELSILAGYFLALFLLASPIQWVVSHRVARAS